MHLAHEHGLETYASAGLQAADLARCVATGLDAVGIGTSLHHRDPLTGAIGQLRDDAIRRALQARDLAEQGVWGVGARLLARLDRQAFEGTLAVALEERRHALHHALRAQDKGKIGELVAGIGAPDGVDLGEPAIVQQARRMVQTAGSHPVGADRMGEETWSARVRAVTSMLEVKDLSGLTELLR